MSLARRLAKRVIWAAVVVVVLAGLALVFAPYLFAELSASLDPHAIIDPAKPNLGEGRMVDDYWAVQNIVENTYALGEPHVTSRPSTSISLSVQGGRWAGGPSATDASAITVRDHHY